MHCVHGIRESRGGASVENGGTKGARGGNGQPAREKRFGFFKWAFGVEIIEGYFHRIRSSGED